MSQIVVRNDVTDEVLVTLDAVDSEFGDVDAAAVGATVVSVTELLTILNAAPSLGGTPETAMLVTPAMQLTPFGSAPFMLTGLDKYPEGLTLTEVNGDEWAPLGATNPGLLATQREVNATAYGNQTLSKRDAPDRWVRTWVSGTTSWGNWFSVDMTDTATGPGTGSELLTVSWTMTDSASYRPAGWRVEADQVRQGGWADGQHIGCVAFDWDDIATTLTGKTIAAVRLEVERVAGGYTAPRQPKLFSLAPGEVTAGNLLVKSGQPDLVNSSTELLGAIGRGTTILPIGNAFVNRFRAGTAKGLGFAISETLANPGSNDDQYMIFDSLILTVDYYTAPAVTLILGSASEANTAGENKVVLPLGSGTEVNTAGVHTIIALTLGTAFEVDSGGINPGNDKLVLVTASEADTAAVHVTTALTVGTATETTSAGTHKANNATLGTATETDSAGAHTASTP